MLTCFPPKVVVHKKHFKNNFFFLLNPMHSSASPFLTFSSTKLVLHEWTADSTTRTPTELISPFTLGNTIGLQREIPSLPRLNLSERRPSRGRPPLKTCVADRFGVEGRLFTTHREPVGAASQRKVAPKRMNHGI